MDYEYWQRIAANKGRIVRIDKLLSCSREYSATKTKSQVARFTRIFSRANGATGATFIQSGGWDSSITLKTSAAPCGAPSFRLPRAGTYLIFSPVFFAGGLSSLNRGKGAGAGILGDNSV